MHALGILTMIAGFTGVIAFGILGTTRSIPAALIIHGVLLLGFVVSAIRRSGSVTEWINMKAEPIFSVHPSIIVLIGVAFVAAGAWIAAIIEPGSGPYSMTRIDQIYFGSIFACIGAGIIPSAVSAWRSEEKLGRTSRGRQPRQRR